MSAPRYRARIARVLWRRSSESWFAGWRAAELPATMLAERNEGRCPRPTGIRLARRKNRRPAHKGCERACHAASATDDMRLQSPGARSHKFLSWLVRTQVSVSSLDSGLERWPANNKRKDVMWASHLAARKLPCHG